MIKISLVLIFWVMSQGCIGAQIAFGVAGVINEVSQNNKIEEFEEKLKEHHAEIIEEKE